MEKLDNETSGAAALRQQEKEKEQDDQSRPLNPSVISGPDQAATTTETASDIKEIHVPAHTIRVRQAQPKLREAECECITFSHCAKAKRCLAECTPEELEHPMEKVLEDLDRLHQRMDEAIQQEVAALRVVPRAPQDQQEEKEDQDQSRSVEPQLRAGEADPRVKELGSSIQEEAETAVHPYGYGEFDSPSGVEHESAPCCRGRCGGHSSTRTTVAWLETVSFRAQDQRVVVALGVALCAVEIVAEAAARAALEAVKAQVQKKYPHPADHEWFSQQIDQALGSVKGKCRGHSADGSDV